MRLHEKTMPDTALTWHYGICIRAILINLTVGLVSWMHEQMLVFLIWVFVSECLALAFYLAARNPDRIVARHALSWLTVSDLIFAAPALAFVILSGLFMPWSLLGFGSIWAAVIGIQIWIAFTIPLPQQASASYAAFALDGRSKKLHMGRGLDDIVSLYISVVICGIGFAGMLIFEVLLDEPKMLFSMAIMAMGLAGGLSTQTRALALAWRMRNLPPYRRPLRLRP